MAIDKTLCLLFLLLSTVVFSQRRYAVTFTDKNNSNYSINQPEQFLSQKSIIRRAKQGIPITEEDLPVNQNYVDSITSLGATLCNTSRWFNSIVIRLVDTSIVSTILNYPFVLGVETIKLHDTIVKNIKLRSKFQKESNTNINYGFADQQIKIMEGEFLHDLGFKGGGMSIAVLDAGFDAVDHIPAFNHLWNQNRLLGYWDFVNNNDSIFDKHDHGTKVLSTMAGVKESEIVGTAPEASYWLLRSEDADSETISEEYNWLAAAEYADSAGADIINSSLGYTTFDNPLNDHSYSDMDGETTVITKAADIAASKGILVVNSAGNSGNDAWFYIGAPADGKNVLSVGAVEPNGTYANFSSRGPSFDGRIKPNVAAVGRFSAVVNTSGNVVYGNGTSFASPEVAGLSAALWQAFPQKTSLEIKEAIEKSAHQFYNPDDKLGYGIPNFRLAYMLLSGLIVENSVETELLNVYPNPIENEFNILLFSAEEQEIEIKVVDMIGRTLVKQNNHVGERKIETVQLNLHNMPCGVYSLCLTTAKVEITKKIIKI